MQTIEQALEKLSHSKFRCSFHLDSDDKDYIDKKGLDTIALHAADFIEKNWHQPTLLATADRLHGAVIQCSKLSTLVHAAAEDALRNGIMFQKEESLHRTSKAAL